MKSLIIALAMMVGISAFAVDVNEDFLKAIAKVESNGKKLAVGDNGKAYGMYQLHWIYIQDVNNHSAKKYTHQDAFDPVLAKEIVVKYLTRYGKRYEKLTGKTAGPEILARIHNGGPNGWKKSATDSYWRKVKAAGRFK